MNEYQVFLYDRIIKTNYIEKTVKADTILDIYPILKEDNELEKEIIRKFKFVKKIEDIFNGHNYNILKIS